MTSSVCGVLLNSSDVGVGVGVTDDALARTTSASDTSGGVPASVAEASTVSVVEGVGCSSLSSAKDDFADCELTKAGTSYIDDVNVGLTS
jgi:hypothetical protein